jgi:hypothetical protein
VASPQLDWLLFVQRRGDAGCVFRLSSECAGRRDVKGDYLFCEGWGRAERETWRVLIPYGVEAMARLVEGYRGGYNQHRPHMALGGKTPDEVFYGRRSVRELPRYEPRPRFPLGRPPARGAPVAVRGKRGVEVGLVVSHHEELTVLPVVKLRRAA